MDEKYLNEEKYQNANKKLKLAGVIIIIIGLCLMGAGIYYIYQSSQIKVPKMAVDNNWFSAKEQGFNLRARGLMLLFPGFFVTAVGCLVRFFIPNRRAILAYQTQQVMPVATEGLTEMTPTLARTAAELAKEVKKELNK